MKSQLVRGLPKASTSAIVGQSADNHFVSRAKVRVNIGASFPSSDTTNNGNFTRILSRNGSATSVLHNSVRYLSSENATTNSFASGFGSAVSENPDHVADTTPQEEHAALEELKRRILKLEEQYKRGLSVEILCKHYDEYLTHILQNDESGMLLEQVWNSMAFTQVPVPPEQVNKVIAYRSRWLASFSELSQFIQTLCRCSITLDENSVRVMFAWMCASGLIKEDAIAALFSFVRIYVRTPLSPQLFLTLIQSCDSYTLVNGIPMLLHEADTAGIALDDDIMLPVARIFGSLRYGEPFIELMQDRRTQTSIHTLNAFLNACFTSNVRNLRNSLLHHNTKFMDIINTASALDYPFNCETHTQILRYHVTVHDFDSALTHYRLMRSTIDEDTQQTMFPTPHIYSFLLYSLTCKGGKPDIAFALFHEDVLAQAPIPAIVYEQFIMTLIKVYQNELALSVLKIYTDAGYLPSFRLLERLLTRKTNIPQTQRRLLYYVHLLLDRLVIVPTQFGGIAASQAVEVPGEVVNILNDDATRIEVETTRVRASGYLPSAADKITYDTTGTLHPLRVFPQLPLEEIPRYLDQGRDGQTKKRIDIHRLRVAALGSDDACVKEVSQMLQLHEGDMKLIASGTAGPELYLPTLRENAFKPEYDYTQKRLRPASEQMPIPRLGLPVRLVKYLLSLRDMSNLDLVLYTLRRLGQPVDISSLDSFLDAVAASDPSLLIDVFFCLRDITLNYNSRTRNAYLAAYEYELQKATEAAQMQAQVQEPGTNASATTHAVNSGAEEDFVDLYEDMDDALDTRRPNDSEGMTQMQYDKAAAQVEEGWYDPAVYAAAVGHNLAVYEQQLLQAYPDELPPAMWMVLCSRVMASKNTVLTTELARRMQEVAHLPTAYHTLFAQLELRDACVRGDVGVAADVLERYVQGLLSQEIHNQHLLSTINTENEEEVASLALCRDYSTTDLFTLVLILVSDKVPTVDEVASIAPSSSLLYEGTSILSHFLRSTVWEHVQTSSSEQQAFVFNVLSELTTRLPSLPVYTPWNETISTPNTTSSTTKGLSEDERMYASAFPSFTAGAPTHSLATLEQLTGFATPVDHFSCATVTSESASSSEIIILQTPADISLPNLIHRFGTSSSTLILLLSIAMLQPTSHNPWPALYIVEALAHRHGILLGSAALKPLFQHHLERVPLPAFAKKPTHRRSMEDEFAFLDASDSSTNTSPAKHVTTISENSITDYTSRVMRLHYMALLVANFPQATLPSASEIPSHAPPSSFLYLAPPLANALARMPLSTLVPSGSAGSNGRDSAVTNAPKVRAASMETLMGQNAAMAGMAQLMGLSLGQDTAVVDNESSSSEGSAERGSRSSNSPSGIPYKNVVHLNSLNVHTFISHHYPRIPIFLRYAFERKMDASLTQTAMYSPPPVGHDVSPLLVWTQWRHEMARLVGYLGESVFEEQLRIAACCSDPIAIYHVLHTLIEKFGFILSQNMVHRAVEFLNSKRKLDNRAHVPAIRDAITLLVNHIITHNYCVSADTAVAIIVITRATDLLALTARYCTYFLEAQHHLTPKLSGAVLVAISLPRFDQLASASLVAMEGPNATNTMNNVNAALPMLEDLPPSVSLAKLLYRNLRAQNLTFSVVFYERFLSILGRHESLQEEMWQLFYSFRDLVEARVNARYQTQMQEYEQELEVYHNTLREYLLAQMGRDETFRNLDTLYDLRRAVSSRRTMNVRVASTPSPYVDEDGNLLDLNDVKNLDVKLISSPKHREMFLAMKKALVPPEKPQFRVPLSMSTALLKGGMFIQPGFTTVAEIIATCEKHKFVTDEFFFEVLFGGLCRVPTTQIVPVFQELVEALVHHTKPEVVDTYGRPCRRSLPLTDGKAYIFRAIDLRERVGTLFLRLTNLNCPLSRLMWLFVEFHKVGVHPPLQTFIDLLHQAITENDAAAVATLISTYYKTTRAYTLAQNRSAIMSPPLLHTDLSLNLTDPDNGIWAANTSHSPNSSLRTALAVQDNAVGSSASSMPVGRALGHAHAKPISPEDPMFSVTDSVVALGSADGVSSRLVWVKAPKPVEAYNAMMRSVEHEGEAEVEEDADVHADTDISTTSTVDTSSFDVSDADTTSTSIPTHVEDAVYTDVPQSTSIDTEAALADVKTVTTASAAVIGEYTPYKIPALFSRVPPRSEGHEYRRRDLLITFQRTLDRLFVNVPRYENAPTPEAETDNEKPQDGTFESEVVPTELPFGEDAASTSTDSPLSVAPLIESAIAHQATIAKESLRFDCDVLLPLRELTDVIGWSIPNRTYIRCLPQSRLVKLQKESNMEREDNLSLDRSLEGIDSGMAADDDIPYNNDTLLAQIDSYTESTTASENGPSYDGDLIEKRDSIMPLPPYLTHMSPVPVNDTFSRYPAYFESDYLLKSRTFTAVPTGACGPSSLSASLLSTALDVLVRSGQHPLCVFEGFYLLTRVMGGPNITIPMLRKAILGMRAAPDAMVRGNTTLGIPVRSYVNDLIVAADVTRNLPCHRQQCSQIAMQAELTPVVQWEGLSAADFITVIAQSLPIAITKHTEGQHMAIPSTLRGGKDGLSIHEDCYRLQPATPSSVAAYAVKLWEDAVSLPHDALTPDILTALFSTLSHCGVLHLAGKAILHQFNILSKDHLPHAVFTTAIHSLASKEAELAPSSALDFAFTMLRALDSTVAQLARVEYKTNPVAYSKYAPLVNTPKCLPEDHPLHGYAELRLQLEEIISSTLLRIFYFVPERVPPTSLPVRPTTTSKKSIQLSHALPLTSNVTLLYPTETPISLSRISLTLRAIASIRSYASWARLRPGSSSASSAITGQTNNLLLLCPAGVYIAPTVYNTIAHALETSLELVRASAVKPNTNVDESTNVTTDAVSASSTLSSAANTLNTTHDLPSEAILSSALQWIISERDTQADLIAREPTHAPGLLSRTSLPNVEKDTDKAKRGRRATRSLATDVGASTSGAANGPALMLIPPFPLEKNRCAHFTSYIPAHIDLPLVHDSFALPSVTYVHAAMKDPYLTLDILPVAENTDTFLPFLSLPSSTSTTTTSSTNTSVVTTSDSTASLNQTSTSPSTTTTTTSDIPDVISDAIPSSDALSSPNPYILSRGVRPWSIRDLITGNIVVTMHAIAGKPTVHTVREGAVLSQLPDWADASLAHPAKQELLHMCIWAMSTDLPPISNTFRAAKLTQRFIKFPRSMFMSGVNDSLVPADIRNWDTCLLQFTQDLERARLHLPTRNANVKDPISTALALPSSLLDYALPRVTPASEIIDKPQSASKEATPHEMIVLVTDFVPLLLQQLSLTSKRNERKHMGTANHDGATKLPFAPPALVTALSNINVPQEPLPLTILTSLISLVVTLYHIHRAPIQRFHASRKNQFDDAQRKALPIISGTFGTPPLSSYRQSSESPSAHIFPRIFLLLARIIGSSEATSRQHGLPLSLITYLATHDLHAFEDALTSSSSLRSAEQLLRQFSVDISYAFHDAHSMRFPNWLHTLARTLHHEPTNAVRRVPSANDPDTLVSCPMRLTSDIDALDLAVSCAFTMLAPAGPVLARLPPDWPTEVAQKHSRTHEKHGGSPTPLVDVYRSYLGVSSLAPHLISSILCLATRAASRRTLDIIPQLYIATAVQLPPSHLLPWADFARACERVHSERLYAPVDFRDIGESSPSLAHASTPPFAPTEASTQAITRACFVPLLDQRSVSQMQQRLVLLQPLSMLFNVIPRLDHKISSQFLAVYVKTAAAILPPSLSRLSLPHATTLKDHIFDTCRTREIGLCLSHFLDRTLASRVMSLYASGHIEPCINSSSKTPNASGNSPILPGDALVAVFKHSTAHILSLLAAVAPSAFETPYDSIPSTPTNIRHNPALAALPAHIRNSVKAATGDLRPPPLRNPADVPISVPGSIIAPSPTPKYAVLAPLVEPHVLAALENIATFLAELDEMRVNLGLHPFAYNHSSPPSELNIDNGNFIVPANARSHFNHTPPAAKAPPSKRTRAVKDDFLFDMDAYLYLVRTALVAMPKDKRVERVAIRLMQDIAAAENPQEPCPAANMWGLSSGATTTTTSSPATSTVTHTMESVAVLRALHPATHPIARDLEMRLQNNPEWPIQM